VRDGKLFQWQKASGQAVTVNDMTVTPQSQVLIVRWPRGAFVWNRPTAILVERNGQTEQRPIVNVTRTLLLGFVGLSMAFAIASMIRRKEKEA
jgi:hypothetical protein